MDAIRRCLCGLGRRLPLCGSEKSSAGDQELSRPLQGVGEELKSNHTPLVTPMPD